ncbi:hypothetical protein Pst134EA_022717 [Puccinia striiformis f. sp. tritici]|uniref:hypothetical protein n=1 Tax=Puccinia striiformis f. sp. tritici TaxID=168172 RepID=UPI00200795F1|nr:hypothetical protein Pst134EA_022717 [Puccinia striiformis f. sp. tritici]KAH9455244.1 hypothetical protein Pst134EA_022717 [Puccinia striiformis f. sp. tritici]
MLFLRLSRSKEDAPRATISAAFPNDPKVTAAINTVKTNGPRFLAAIADLEKATDPASLKIKLKSVTDQRVALIKANTDLMAAANGATKK